MQACPTRSSKHDLSGKDVSPWASYNNSCVLNCTVASTFPRWLELPNFFHVLHLNMTKDTNCWQLIPPSTEIIQKKTNVDWPFTIHNNISNIVEIPYNKAVIVYWRVQWELYYTCEGSVAMETTFQSVQYTHCLESCHIWLMLTRFLIFPRKIAALSRLNQISKL